MAKKRMSEADRQRMEQEHYELYGKCYAPPNEGIVAWIGISYYKIEIISIYEDDHHELMASVRAVPGKRCYINKPFRDYGANPHSEDYFLSEGEVPFRDIYVNGRQLTMEIYQRLWKGAADD